MFSVIQIFSLFSKGSIGKWMEATQTLKGDVAGHGGTAPPPIPEVMCRGIADMPANRLVPELSVSDLNKSLHFYRDILGFKVEFERPEDRFAYMSFYGSELMIEEDYEREDEAALWIVEPLDYPRGRGLNISIDCPSARDLIERLKGAGVPLRKPVEDCWYRDNDTLHGQRNFLVQDPDGYLLRFAESLGTKPSEK